MKNALFTQLIDWHKSSHNFSLSNIPTSKKSKALLDELITNILLPLNDTLGDITITYGFTSPSLVRYIQKNSPKGTAPSLDQHACDELNLNNNAINKRSGAACDFYVKGFENRMNLVVLYICEHLNFDKIYYYGKDRPIHVSINNSPEKHLQVMCISDNGRRYPGLKAYNNDAIKLAKDL